MRRLLALLPCALCLAGQDTLRLEVEPLPAATRVLLEKGESGRHLYVQEGWFTWCPSLIREPSGHWRLFHSRWPASRTFAGWLTHSEVASAAGASPEGPFGAAATVLPAGDGAGGAWFNAHNPKIERFGERHWLHFIRTRGAGMEEEGRAAVARTGPSHPAWKRDLRPNQRTFAARAPSLDGPWEILPEPLLEPSGPIRVLAVNPAVVARPQGGYLMIVKGDRPGARDFVRNQAVALAPDPAGPWRLQPEPVIADLDTEDISAWHDPVRDRYYAVFHATGPDGFIGMMTSEDGVRWTRAAQFRLTDKRLRFDDGTSLVPSMLERPWVLRDDQGRPTHLLCAVGLRATTGILILRLSAR